MRNMSEEDSAPRDGLGLVPTSFAIHGPKTVPRVDYQRIFVVDDETKPLGEYALRDDCPLEFEDLQRSIPVNGMRHLVSFYQGEYAFTPFCVENLWFVVLTRGVPRIEDRGSIGTLLAAMRVHLPPSLAPAVAAREAAIQDRERNAETRESLLTRREQRVTQLEADLQIVGMELKELEADVRARENRLNVLRDYALQMQRSIRQTGTKTQVPAESEESPRQPEVSVPPPP